MLTIFHPPLSNIRMDLGVGTLSYQEVKCLHSLCTLCGNLSLSFMLNVYSFVLLKQMHQWSSGMPPAISYSMGEGEGSFYLAPEGVPVGQLPSICFQEGPTGLQGPTPTIEVDLALSLLYVSKALFHPVLDYVVFLGNSDTKMQWAEVFRLLFFF